MRTTGQGNLLWISPGDGAIDGSSSGLAGDCCGIATSASPSAALRGAFGSVTRFVPAPDLKPRANQRARSFPGDHSKHRERFKRNFFIVVLTMTVLLLALLLRQL